MKRNEFIGFTSADDSEAEIIDTDRPVIETAATVACWMANGDAQRVVPVSATYELRGGDLTMTAIEVIVANNKEQAAALNIQYNPPSET